MSSILFKIILSIWPFLREMLFGKKAPSEIVSRNKTTLISIILNVLQTIVIFFLIDLTVSLSTDNGKIREKQFAGDSEFKVQVIVLKSTLEQTQKDMSLLRKENEILREGLGRADPDRRKDINARLEKLRGH